MIRGRLGRSGGGRFRGNLLGRLWGSFINPLENLLHRCLEWGKLIVGGGRVSSEVERG